MSKESWAESLLTIWACGLAVLDYRQRRLPNSLTLGAAGVAIVYLLIYGRSMLGASPLSAVIAGISAILLMSPFMWLGWLGAGDIKLLSAIGFISGAQILATTFLLSSLLTLPVALWLSMGHFKPDRAASKNVRLPQGVFIALGLILSMLGNDAIDKL